MSDFRKILKPILIRAPFYLCIFIVAAGLYGIVTGYIQESKSEQPFWFGIALLGQFLSIPGMILLLISILYSKRAQLSIRRIEIVAGFTFSALAFVPLITMIGHDLMYPPQSESKDAK